MQRLGIGGRVDLARDIESQPGPFVQRLRNLRELVLLARRKRVGGAGRKFHICKVLATTPGQRADQRKWRRRDLDEQVTMILTTMPNTENCGSSSEPLTGRLRSISPFEFFSSDTANSTGSFVASGLSTLSPKVRKVGRQPGYRAVDVGDVGRLIRFDEAIGKVDPRRSQRDAIDRHRWRAGCCGSRAGRRIRCRRWGSRWRCRRAGGRRSPGGSRR